MICDPEIIKHVLVRDFDHFVDRNSIIDLFQGTSDTDRVWCNVMITMKGDEWKEVRSTFSPIFTSGKMKLMMRIMNGISEDLVAAVQNTVSEGVELDLKKLFQFYSMDTIASCAFGFDAGEEENIPILA
jgi:cytochrome P450